MMQIPASDSAIAAAKTRADSVFLLLRGGEEFEQLARRFTEEPGGRERGGDLGWIQESDVVREFARVAFGTPPGAYSYPFQTSYGWHILKVERRRGPEAHVRHILFMPEVRDADLERALERADSVAELLRSGASFAPLARQFNDPDFEPRVGPAPPDEYQQRFGADVADAQPGTVIGPVPVGDGPARRLLVARVVERTPAGSWSFEDDQVRKALSDRLTQQALMKELVAELRRSIYVKVYPQ
jgi:parvulin-like peptidyl-prolyl isomerase